MEFDYIGAIKIKDGLFLGDQFAAQDLEFVVTNKVSRIINCASKQIPNHWESIGIVYLTFPWLDNDTQVIFDSKDEIINQCFKFIEEALNAGESVIVHSVRGHNRSVCILAGYFMKKFRWTLYKTLQYLHNRRPDLEIRANFFNQLLALESRFQKAGLGAKTYNWDDVNNEGEACQEELLLRNTYLNAQSQGVADFKDNGKENNFSIKWLDQERKENLETTYIPPYEKIDFNNRSKKLNKSAVSILKKEMSEQYKQEKKSELPQPPQLQKKQEPSQPIQPQQIPQPVPQQQPVLQQVGSLKEFMKPKTTKNEQKIDQRDQTLNSLANQQLSKKYPQVQESDTKQQEIKQNNDQSKVNNYMRNQKIEYISANQTLKNQQQYIKPKVQQFQPSNQVQSNNMGWSNESWFTKSQKKQQNDNRPSTAPFQKPAFQQRQNKNQQQELIVTSYKRQGSLGTRAEPTGTGTNQFKTKQRLYSPNNAYHANPYVQKQFRAKQLQNWKK